MTPESTHVIEPASASERGPLLTPRDREDIQAIALFGTSAAHLRYHFLAIEDAARARDFVGSLLEPGPLIVNTAGAGQTAADREHLVYVAFTWPGLRALGLDEASLASFPPAFREGARRRSPALGGVTAEDARMWTIADDVAHLVVTLYRREKQTLFEQSTTLYRASPAKRLRPRRLRRRRRASGWHSCGRPAADTPGPLRLQRWHQSADDSWRGA